MSNELVSAFCRCHCHPQWLLIRTWSHCSSTSCWWLFHSSACSFLFWFSRSCGIYNCAHNWFSSSCLLWPCIATNNALRRHLCVHWSRQQQQPCWPGSWTPSYDSCTHYGYASSSFIIHFIYSHVYTDLISCTSCKIQINFLLWSTSQVANFFITLNCLLMSSPYSDLRSSADFAPTTTPFFLSSCSNCPSIWLIPLYHPSQTSYI